MSSQLCLRLPVFLAVFPLSILQLATSHLPFPHIRNSSFNIYGLSKSLPATPIHFPLLSFLVPLQLHFSPQAKCFLKPTAFEAAFRKDCTECRTKRLKRACPQPSPSLPSGVSASVSRLGPACLTIAVGGRQAQMGVQPRQYGRVVIHASVPAIMEAPDGSSPVRCLLPGPSGLGR